MECCGPYPVYSIIKRFLPTHRLRALVPAIFLCWAVLAQNVSPAFGVEVSLAWDPPQDPTIAGYLLYYGPESGAETYTIGPTTATEVTISALPFGETYFFSAVSVNFDGLESQGSDTIYYRIGSPPESARAASGTNYEGGCFIGSTVMGKKRGIVIKALASLLHHPNS